jgi:hypothetical protein
MSPRSWLGPLLFAIVGCTRQAEPAPPKVVLAPPKPVVDQADRFEASLRAIDLRQFPLPPEAKLHHIDPHRIVYWMPALRAAVVDCRAKLVDTGWTPNESDTPKNEPEDREEIAFDKAGFRLLLSARKDEDGCVVELTNFGNLDLRLLPRVPDAKITTDRWHVVSFQTESELVHLLEFCRVEFRKLAWHSFPEAETLRLPRGSAGYVRNGVELVVDIDRDVERKLYVVTYNSRLVEPAPPAPKIDVSMPTTLEAARHAIDLERFPRTEETRLKKATAILCEYESKTPLRKIADFYRDRLTAEKWTVEPCFEIDGAIHQSARKEGFLLRLNAFPNGEETCFVGIENQGNFLAQQLPRVPDASRPVEDSPTEVLYGTRLSNEEAIEFYRKLLEPAGWKEISRSVQEDEKTTFLAYRKDATVLEFDIGRRSVRIGSKLTAGE